MPPGYRLLSWNVRNGSSIRKGETIAIAVLESVLHPSAASLELTEPLCDSEIKTKHKRPTRRKRLPALAMNGNSADISQTTTTYSTKMPATKLMTSIFKQTETKNQNDSVVNSSTTVNNDDNNTVPPPAAESSSVQTLDEKITINAEADGIIQIKSSTQQDDPLILGYITECSHPTVVEGLCAVCGLKPNDNKPNTASLQRAVAKMDANDQHHHTASSTTSTTTSKTAPMSRVTVAGLTFSVTEAEGQRIAREDAMRLRKLKKLSLVLDLDHTLVHATADPRARNFSQNRSDVRTLALPVILMDGQRQQIWLQQHFVKLRPHIKEFLETVMPLYEVGIYTAGTREYAEQVTIALCRYFVGAKDQIDLDILRSHVADREGAYKRQENQANGSVDVQPEEMDEDGTEPYTINEEMDPQSQAIQNGESSNDKVRTKRKRVTFNIIPPKKRSTTKQEIENLRAELAEAERLERDALKMRQRLFGSRVVSRSDVGDLGRDVKSLKRIFPCGGEMAAVVDDREDVWANADDIKSTQPGEPPENLLLVRPYHWESFVGFADVNNSSGVDLSGRDEISEESDVQLLWTSDILKRLHHQYYNRGVSEKPTVPKILEQMRKEVLAGCRLVLSGLIPLQMQNMGPDVPRPPFIRFSESLGASIQSQVTHGVTHVVAANDGTDKIMAARRLKGCHVVKVSWLMECVWSLQRRDETLHLLGLPSKNSKSNSCGNKPIQPLCDSTRDNSSTSSSDEDDELAAELETELMGN
jgi:RNA polymerase II subunit A-like phosphatase